MTYTQSNAFSPRGSQLLFQQSVSIGYVLIAEIMQADFSGQKLDLADVTNFQSGIFREYLATLLDSGELTFKGNFIPSDSSQNQLLTYFNTAARVNWELILPINVNTNLPYGHFLFTGFVTTLEWALPIDKQGQLNGKIKITGAITFVAGS
jgi:hypothetical protein